MGVPWPGCWLGQSLQGSCCSPPDPASMFGCRTSLRPPSFQSVRARRCFRFQCLILEFGRLFPTKPISSASSLAERNLSGVQTGPFKGLLPVGAAPPPPRIDLIETRPDPFSGAQGFHQCNNGPLTIRVQQPPTPRPPHPPLPALPIHQSGHDKSTAAPLMWRQSETQSEPESTVGTALSTHVHRSTLRAPNLQN